MLDINHNEMLSSYDTIGFHEVETKKVCKECGNRFTVDYGDINEDFYLALVRMYDKAIDTLFSLDEDTIQVYQHRFKEIMESSSGIGWGYHDDLCDLYYEAFSDFEE